MILKAVGLVGWLWCVRAGGGWGCRRAAMLH
jgi:hypothetical protein